jgi:import inner membrane translocase subunit TIM13
MSWFGFGGSSKKPEDSSSSSSTYSSGDDFGSSSDFVAPSAGVDFGASAGIGGGSFEQELMMEQQKALVQAVMFKLTDLSFETCVTKPGTSLSSSEQSCITAVVGKYLDTSELVVARFQGSQN